MTEANNSAQPQQRKLLTGRRLTLLGSVALVGATIAFGSSAYGNDHRRQNASSTSAGTLTRPHPRIRSMITASPEISAEKRH